MNIPENQIDSIVDRLIHQLSPIKEAKEVRETKEKSSTPASSSAAHPIARGCFNDIEQAIDAARKAFLNYQKMPVECRKKIIENIRVTCHENIKTFARMAVDETGLGRVEDKIVKNKLAIDKTPGVEDLEPIAFTGDDGLTLLEQAPFGVIGSITPCTNATETIISNTIGMIAGGNTVVFNPHPTAKKVAVFTVDLINQAIMAAGGPPNLITTVVNPTIQSAQAMMKHPQINLLVVTGGPAVVKAAMNSGKKVIAAGPGNPPVVVDETADLDKAARDIVTSAGTDNNIICLIEKNIIVLEKVADEFKKYLTKHGAVFLSTYQAKQLEKIIVDGDHPNKNWVGKDVQLILQQIGITADLSKRLAIAETTKDHPFAQIELLMPVLPLIHAKTFEEAMDIAYELEGGRFHTAALHSKNIDHLHQMAVKMNTSIFVKNGPALAGLGLGGEGPTSFTIASPTGEGVTTARHFVRIRRCVLSGGYFRIT